MRYRFLLFLVLFSAFNLLADEIKIGAKVPDITLKNANNEAVSLQKVNEKKVVLIHFWSSIALDSRTNHAALNEVATTYKTTALNGADGFEVFAVGLDKSKEGWEMAIQKDNFTNATHVLDLNALFSVFAKKYNITKLPADFLIDQDGKLIAINPTVSDLKKMLDKFSKIKPTSQLKDILAKLLYGDKKKMPLTHQKVFLLNSGGDTLKSTETDDFGDFSFKQINASQQLNLVVEKNAATQKINDLYLAEQNGQIVSKFSKTASGFEYKLLPKDVFKLDEIPDVEDPEMKIDAFSKSTNKEVILSENIYYPSKEFKIVDQAAKKLDAMVDIMKKNDKLKLEIYSHTDSNGEDAYNLDLSNKRANAALEYMVSKGISKTRIKAVGMGETKIINRCTNGENCSEKEHELNRRTEFKFSK